jgi:hypothetical protein
MKQFRLNNFRNTKIKSLFKLILLLATLFSHAQAYGEVDTTVLLTDEEKRWLIENPEISYASDPDYPP